MSNSNSIPLPTNPKFQDLTGKVFTRLTVVGYAGKGQGRHTWFCKCECGAASVVRTGNLNNGHTQSCGSLGAEHRAHALKSASEWSVGLRGHSARTPEYQVWHGMWKRCTNPKNKRYASYKTRTPPEVWRDFSRFLDDMGPRPQGDYSIERVDNEKPYGPGNCVWALREVQANNTKVNIKVVDVRTNKEQTLSQACREGSLPYFKTWDRLQRLGWSVEHATEGKYTAA